MTTDEALRTRQLFDQAVELPADRRAEFLDQHCTEPGLRALVERLLAADSSVAKQPFLQPPPVLQPPPAEARGTLGAALSSASATLARDPLLGQRIGRYHIKSLLGVGGMARVYEAVQEQPHRVVALKVMSPHASARTALRRFQYESQVLGRLRHPNIAQIYEAGVAPDAEGRPGVEIPYFAMEYLPGARPITSFVVEKAFDVRRRVEIFLKVCDAVHYGHQRGVIHRDLKPANLLVEASGEPKVIDFGVARGTDSDIALTTQQTHLGELVGTMQYMSPEQCDGDPHEIDTRSDVYSLGIVLYELLTGTPPYSVADSTIYQAARIIREHFPERPSVVGGARPAVARALRRDLDAIVLKAIEKDRERRYSSAAALADDLRRALAGEPIQARRRTVWSRATQWVYRHPAATMLVLSSATSALILAGSVMVGWYWGQQPARVEIGGDGRELRIFALNGNQVYWSGPSWMRVFGFAAILDPKQPTTPERPMLVGVSAPPAMGFEAGLNIFDADRGIATAYKVLQVEAAQIPLTLQNRKDYYFGVSSFGVCRGLVADVFDSAGDEIVVAYQHTNTTQTAIVIYDSKWQTRYCVWIDAPADALYWMSETRQLVIVGTNGQFTLNERGMKFSTSANHVPVVFAIQPVLEFISNEYIAQELCERATADQRLVPTWYWMLPNYLVSSVSRLSAPPDSDGVQVDLSFQCESTDASFGVAWVLSEQGVIQGEPRFSTGFDLCRSGAREGFEGTVIPDRSNWILKPLPPVLPGKWRPPGSAHPRE